MASRREFLGALGATALAPGLSRRILPEPPATPTPAQLAWLDLEVGMFVHFAPNTWQDRENDDRSIPAASLPFSADATQWADAAVALGARYVVMVAKHVGGFCLWQTHSSDYSVRNTPWKEGRGDVMADLAEACAARGLKLGVYLSPRDDHFGAGLAGRCATPEKQAAYNRAARTQLTELLTRYGPMVEVWFDGGSVVPVGDLLAAHAKGAMVFQGPHATIRWVGNEDGFAPDAVWNSLAHADARTGVATAIHGDAHGSAWMPLEVDVSMRRPNWFWSTTNATRLLSLEQLMDIYYRSVGRGTQLLLNMMPDRSGRIPLSDVARGREFGNEVRRRFGTPVGSATGGGELVTLTLRGRQRVDHVILQEDLRQGQRVLRYRLEGHDAGGWRKLGDGTTVGRQRIHPVEPAEYDALRVSFPGALDPGVLLRRFSAHGAGAAPPEQWQQGAATWADDEVGGWSRGVVALDLTARIESPGQYRLRLVPPDRTEVTGADVTVSVGGVGQPDLVRPERGRRDVWILTITGLGQKIELGGRVRGAATGVILLRRL